MSNLMVLPTRWLFDDTVDRFVPDSLDEGVAQKGGLFDGQDEHAPAKAMMAQGETDTIPSGPQLDLGLCLYNSVGLLGARRWDGRLHLTARENEFLDELVYLLGVERVVVQGDSVVAVDSEKGHGALRNE